AELAARVTESLSIPTIGIGAGAACDAQVLVWQDMGGLTPHTAEFVKRDADVAGGLSGAARAVAEGGVGGQVPDAGPRYRRTGPGSFVVVVTTPTFFCGRCHNDHMSRADARRR